MLEMDLSSWLFFGVRTKYNGSEDRVQFDKNGNRVQDYLRSRSQEETCAEFRIYDLPLCMD